jgi:ribosomal protein L31
VHYKITIVQQQHTSAERRWQATGRDPAMIMMKKMKTQTKGRTEQTGGKSDKKSNRKERVKTQLQQDNLRRDSTCHQIWTGEQTTKAEVKRAARYKEEMREI